MAAPKRLLIDGAVSMGFEPVREAFIENFALRGEPGAACCIYQDGEKVVDLWGGVRDRASGEPWRADTMVVVHSTTKGLAAMVMALAHSRGTLSARNSIDCGTASQSVSRPGHALVGPACSGPRRLGRRGILGLPRCISSAISGSVPKASGASLFFYAIGAVQETLEAGERSCTRILWHRAPGAASVRAWHLTSR